MALKLIAKHVPWRWIIYINHNLPLSRAALALLILFLRLRYRREGNLINCLKYVDFDERERFS